LGFPAKDPVGTEILGVVRSFAAPPPCGRASCPAIFFCAAFLQDSALLGATKD